MTTAATTPPAPATTEPPPGPAAGGAGGGVPASTSPTTTTALGSAANGAAQTASTDAAKTDGKPADAQADVELKFPDGFKADGELVDSLKALTKKSGLKGEDAQGLADLYVKSQEKLNADLTAGWEKQHKDWKEAQKADKEYGGAEYAKNLEVAKSAVAKFGDPALTEFLKGPYGDHPALVRLFYRVGKAMSEDSSARGGSGGPKNQNSEEEQYRLLYPSMYPSKE